MEAEIRRWVEQFAREWIQALEKPKRPKVLFIFCDSSAHEPFSDTFIELQNQGIAYDMLFLDGETSAWLGFHRLECAGSGKVIAADEYAPAPIELSKEYAGVVIPEIDLDNAARIAAGMKGTVKAEIVFSALTLNKFVIVGSDVPGIKRSDRRSLRVLELPVPYAKLFRRYMGQLRELGIAFCEQKQLAKAVTERLSAEKPASVDSMPEKDGKRTADIPTDIMVFPEKLITAQQVRSFAEQNIREIRMRKETVISPLALDLLKEQKISVQYSEDR
ncbi:hypothetical protein [Ferviditalea candida]|uniref:Uncharacterized protein n=1 Tax=Ferviditalea candida TaxID=3108399 RepID=A0ABU5ZGI2_9BACL|nr:hypothetical protein [Paenibacillaceae bacterium T2]